jgi:hypothetical protein
MKVLRKCPALIFWEKYVTLFVCQHTLSLQLKSINFSLYITVNYKLVVSISNPIMIQGTGNLHLSSRGPQQKLNRI